jgi:hypothetical protein
VQLRNNAKCLPGVITPWSEVITRTGELSLVLAVLRGGPDSLAADRHQLLGYPLIREL